MSMMLMVQAMKAKVGNPSRKLVLLKLADSANDSGECFPSYQYIAEQCELSRRAVMKYVAELKEMGFLWVEKRKNGTVNFTNIYHLTIASGSLKNNEKSSEQDALGSEQDALGSEQDALGGSEQCSLIRTSHSSYPIKEPIKRTDAKRKKTDSHQADLQTLRDLGVDEQAAQDWLQTRKEKRAGSLKPTVVAALQREAAKAGLTVAQAVQVAAERNWARFMASYLHNEQQGFSGSPHSGGIKPNRITHPPKHGPEAQSGLARDVLKGIL